MIGQICSIGADGSVLYNQSNLEKDHEESCPHTPPTSQEDAVFR